jgi:hypothetical protein
MGDEVVGGGQPCLRHGVSGQSNGRWRRPDGRWPSASLLPRPLVLFDLTGQPGQASGICRRSHRGRPSNAIARSSAATRGQAVGRGRSGADPVRPRGRAVMTTALAGPPGYSNSSRPSCSRWRRWRPRGVGTWRAAGTSGGSRKGRPRCLIVDDRCRRRPPPRCDRPVVVGPEDPRRPTPEFLPGWSAAELVGGGLVAG